MYMYKYADQIKFNQTNFEFSMFPEQSGEFLEIELQEKLCLGKSFSYLRIYYYMYMYIHISTIGTLVSVLKHDCRSAHEIVSIYSVSRCVVST